MAKLRLSDKTQRVLTLLMAMRSTDVRRAAAAAGFDGVQIDKGWELLRAAAGGRLDAPAAIPVRDDGALARLDDWENEWYPVISATLQYNFPAVHAAVFQALAQTEGAELMVSIPTLLGRLAAVPDEAKALLAKRGVTAEELAKPAALVAHIQAAEAVVAPPVDSAALEAALEAAEDAMWNHYLEWSQILRAKVKRPAHLARMGFASGLRKPREDAPDDPINADNGET